MAPGTSYATNPNAMDTLTHDVLFTNVAQTPDGDVWWEGMTKEAPPHLTDWHGNDWTHGTFIGSTIASETTAAASGQVGQIRRDPMAMVPFCGYHMGDYFSHWLEIPLATTADKMPKIFGVNWFRRGEDGHFLWPGFGENARVLKWIFERTDDEAEAQTTPIGLIPAEGALDLSGLDIDATDLEQLFAIDANAWYAEAASIREFYKIFGEHLPADLKNEVENLEQRLKEGE